MASDSEGLRPTRAPIKAPSFSSRKWLPIRKGYDFCSGGPQRASICRKWLPIRKGYDTVSMSLMGNMTCRKWLPIRKGYDPIPFSESARHSYVENGFRFGRVTTSANSTRWGRSFCRKWLPIRKGYDIVFVDAKDAGHDLSKMASDSEGLRRTTRI